MYSKEKITNTVKNSVRESERPMIVYMYKHICIVGRHIIIEVGGLNKP